MPKHYIAAAIIIITLREHAGYVESVYTGQLQHRVCWSCVSGSDLKWSSSVVECMDVALDAKKLNSSSEEFKQQTDNTPITWPFHEQLPVHPLTVHLQHHMDWCAHNTCSPLYQIQAQIPTHPLPMVHTPPHAHSHLHCALSSASNPWSSDHLWRLPVDQCGCPPCTQHWSGTHRHSQSLLQHNRLWARPREGRFGGGI